MFALRQVGEHREKNTAIGNEYEFVGCVSQEKEFNIAHKMEIGEEAPNRKDWAGKDPKIFAFVSFKGQYIPLYSSEKNYIMSSNGQTFAKLNFN